jgi:hypothetical protein
MKANRYVFCRFWIVLTMAGFGMLANADNSVPPLINYQGQLTNANGNPQTGTKKLEFNIYDASSGGNKIWGPQTFNDVPLIGGRFNVILGSTDAGGNAITSAFGGNSRFLGIKVDNATEVAPRQQILSTPFAIQALSASNADNAVYALHGVPPGTIVAYWSTAIPAGWLLCDGSGIPAGVAYDKLRALIGGNVPDLRGIFLRGAGQNANGGFRYSGDAGRTVGSGQGDDFRSHAHTLDDYTFAESYNGNWGWYGSGKTDTDNGPMDPYRHDTFATGGEETRPKNIAVNWIIKY